MAYGIERASLLVALSPAASGSTQPCELTLDYWPLLAGLTMAAVLALV